VKYFLSLLKFLFPIVIAIENKLFLLLKLVTMPPRKKVQEEVKVVKLITRHDKLERITTLLKGRFTPQDFVLGSTAQGLLYLVDPRTGETLKKLSGNGDVYNFFYLSAEGSGDPLIILNTQYGIKYWDLLFGTEEEAGQIELKDKSDISGYRWNVVVLSNKLIGMIDVAKQGQKSFDVFDVRKNKLVKNIDISYASAVMESIPHTTLVILANFDDSLKLFDYKTGKIVRTFDTTYSFGFGFSKKIQEITLLSNNRFLAKTYADVFAIFDLETGAVLDSHRWENYSNLLGWDGDKLLASVEVRDFLTVKSSNIQIINEKEDIGPFGRSGPNILDSYEIYSARMIKLSGNRIAVSGWLKADHKDHVLLIIEIRDNKFHLLKKFKRTFERIIWIPPFPLDLKILKCVLKKKLKNYLPSVLINEVTSFQF
jgi:WD40 repeat protein